MKTCEDCKKPVSEQEWDIHTCSVQHCEAGPKFCSVCHKESKPTYGSEEVRKLREVIESQAKIIAKLEQTAPAKHGWQPAETAPKDARILFIPKRQSTTSLQEPVNICWWSERDDGWKSDLCNDFGGTEDFDFWMPLPPIPRTPNENPT